MNPYTYNQHINVRIPLIYINIAMRLVFFRIYGSMFLMTKAQHVSWKHQFCPSCFKSNLKIPTIMKKVQYCNLKCYHPNSQKHIETLHNLYHGLWNTMHKKGGRVSILLIIIILCSSISEKNLLRMYEKKVVFLWIFAQRGRVYMYQPLSQFHRNTSLEGANDESYVTFKF